MIPRSEGFLSEKQIDHNSEQFKYIAELHDYLWRFMRCLSPGIGGNLRDLLDTMIERFERNSLAQIIALAAKDIFENAMDNAVNIDGSDRFQHIPDSHWETITEWNNHVEECFVNVLEEYGEGA